MASDEDLLKDAKEAFSEAESTGAENRADALADLKFARLAARSSGRPRSSRSAARSAPGRDDQPHAGLHPPGRQRRPAEQAEHQGPSGRQRRRRGDGEGARRPDPQHPGEQRRRRGLRHRDRFRGQRGLRLLARRRRVHGTTASTRRSASTGSPTLLGHGDPRSTAADSSDWNVAFVVDTIGKEELVARLAQAEAVGWDAYQGLNPPWLVLDGDDVTVPSGGSARRSTRRWCVCPTARSSPTTRSSRWPMSSRRSGCRSPASARPRAGRSRSASSRARRCWRRTTGRAVDSHRAGLRRRGERRGQAVFPLLDPRCQARR